MEYQDVMVVTWWMESFSLNGDLQNTVQHGMRNDCPGCRFTCKMIMYEELKAHPLPGVKPRLLVIRVPG